MDDTNQHYVTKAFLDWFIHPTSPDNVLYPYRKGGNACKPRGTKRLGSAINFYRQRVDGQLSDQLDQARTAAERLLFASGKSNPAALAKLAFDERPAISQGSELELAAAAAFLYCGCPVVIHNVAMHSLAYHQIDLFNRLNSADGEKLYREKFGDDGLARLAEDRQKLLKGEIVVDVGRENWKQLGFNAFHLEKDVIDLLLGMNVTLVACQYQSFFVTGDSPVVRLYPSSEGAHDDEVWFPISYRRGLLWHRRRADARRQLGKSATSLRNRQIIKHAYKFVYSPLTSVDIESATRAETFDPRVGHYGSLEKFFAAALPAVSPSGERLGEIVELMGVMRGGKRMDVVGI